MSAEAQEPPVNRIAITICVMCASMLQTLDTTIANVALPYMQANMSASLDEIGWVLTSYIVAAAIMTPPTGFLAGRFGVRRVFLWAVVGFTVASMMCGLAQSLTEIVTFRLLQGFAGAALVPLAQTTVISVTPREKQATALAFYGIATLIGPVIGPVLGGWLTENFSWRYVFYINLPIGLFTFIGLATFLPKLATDRRTKLDWFGFATLSLAVGAIQLCLDRGSKLDWFGSTEICVEVLLAGSAFYLFLVHMFTARETPFVTPELFRDRNFTASCFLMFIVGLLYYATMAIQPTFLQNLMGEPVGDAGILMAPRAVGTMVSLLIAGKLIGRIDVRYLMVVGLIVTAWSLNEMSGWTPAISGWSFLSATFLQGLGTGCLVLPLNVTVFSTLAPSRHAEGAGVYGLFRNTGSSIGVTAMSALLVRNIQFNHAEIAGYVNPLNRALDQHGQVWNPMTSAGQAALNAAVDWQAQIIAYVDEYKALMIATLTLIPFMMLLNPARSERKPSTAPAE